MNLQHRNFLGKAFPIVLAFVIGASASTALFLALNDFDKSASDELSLLEPDPAEPRSVPTNDANTHLDHASRTGGEIPLKDQTLRSFYEIDKFKSRFQRTLVLHTMLSNADEDLTLELLNQAIRMPLDGGRDDVEVVIQRLAQLNPRRAYSQFEKISERYSSLIIRSIFNEWAASNLEEAISFASTLEGRSKLRAADGILRATSDLSKEHRIQIARRLDSESLAMDWITRERLRTVHADPEQAWSDLMEISAEVEIRAQSIVRVAVAWVEKSGVGVMDQISAALVDSPHRWEVLNGVIFRAARIDPEGTLAFALDLETEDSLDIARYVVLEWTDASPKSALNAARSIKSSDLREPLLETVVGRWSWNDPRAVLEQIESIPENFHSLASSRSLYQIAEQDPIEATQFVARIEDPKIKMQGAASVVSIWSESYPKEALNWVLAEPSLRDFRTELLSQVLRHVTEVDPQLAMDTALDHPVPEEEVGLEVGVIRQICPSDIQMAVEFLPRVREGRTRLDAYRVVGAQYVRTDEALKAIELGDELSDTARNKYLQSIVSIWALVNPQELFQSMDRLPSVEVQSSAALALIGLNRQNKKLTNEQIDRVRKFLSPRHVDALDDL